MSRHVFLPARSAHCKRGRLMKSKSVRHLLAFSVLCVATAAPAAAEEAKGSQDGVAFFNREVLPILKANCFSCHGGEKVKGELRLSSRSGLLKGGEGGPAFDADDPAASSIIEAINYESYEMPPKGKLANSQIATITKWVRMGAPYPESMLEDGHGEEHGGPPPVNEETMKWWSFQKVQRPAIPEVVDRSSLSNPVDAFLQHRREEADLPTNPPADKAALMRRAYYDLTGLPPTPDQARAFLSNDSPNAYENLLDELLKSPHYGEKWARHWLDLVRYGESNSYERDGTKPHVWRYRDYVIEAFNDDKPYDQFIIEQLAGDEVAEPSNESIIATGYYRLGIWQDEPVDPLESLYNDLDDILITTGESFLGLTIGCARCHDHKIDPIPQRDYYSMLAFFRNVRRYGNRSADSVEAASVAEIDLPGEPGDVDRQIKDWENKKTKTAKMIAQVEDAVYKVLTDVEKEDFQYEMNKIPLVEKQIEKLKVGNRLFVLNQFRKYKANKNLFRDLEEQRPRGLARALCVKEHGRKALATHILARGNAHAKGEEVQPAFPSVLAPPAPRIVPPPEGVKSSGRRLALAKWIASEDNPLTARVLMNRLWQHHFGRGIVRSTSDYGFQGSPPTHPKLLDWLAAEFMDGGWTIKRMHKIMMMSAAYRMSSRGNDEAMNADADNDYFWRFNMRRLLAEEIRDSVLAVNGRLNLTDMYGPSVYPVIPAEVLHGLSRPGANWLTSKKPEELYRRTIYVHVKRSLPLPMVASFDGADPDKSCPVRFVTIQPTQALGMLNSDFFNDQADAFARSLRADGPMSDKVEHILWKTMQREPTTEEIARGIEFMQSMQDNENATEADALKYFCLLALNLNEFIYLD